MQPIPLKLSGTNCFLLQTPNKYALVDTGYEHDWELFCNRLRAAQVDMSDISYIILTHAHDDHCGLLNKVLENNGEIRIVMSHLAKDLLLLGRNHYNPGAGYVNKRIKALWPLKTLYLSAALRKPIDKKKNLTFPPYETRPGDILLTAETRLDDLGIELQGKVIQTPGHTIDSISVLLDDGDCFVGDAAANVLRFAGTKYCIVGVSDIEEYYRSWRRIIEGHAKMIYPAHGRPFPVDRLKENLGKIRKEDIVPLR